MRPWNPSSFLPPLSLVFGFYSTYEALKRFRPSVFDLTQNTCFYSTYEALKLSSLALALASCCSFLLYLWGIETRVPRILYLYIISPFLLYLWGIETSERTPKPTLFPVSFLLYLWGIETQKAWLDLKMIIGCFYSTYEALKHISIN